MNGLSKLIKYFHDTNAKQSDIQKLLIEVKVTEKAYDTSKEKLERSTLIVQRQALLRKQKAITKRLIATKAKKNQL